MVSVLARTLIIYLSLILVMRLMGKRQIGELEISDLVTTFLISEIASLPITDIKIPLSHAIVPIIILLALEVAISMLLSKFPKLKFIFSTRPATLIRNGILQKKALENSRLSFDELFSQLRQKGYDDISQIKYAILEQNGNITVIQKAPYKTPTAEQLNISCEESGLFHIIIERGRINKHGLEEIGYTKEKLVRRLSKQNISPKNVYLMMINDADDMRIILKDNIKERK